MTAINRGRSVARQDQGQFGLTGLPVFLRRITLATGKVVLYPFHGRNRGEWRTRLTHTPVNAVTIPVTDHPVNVTLQANGVWRTLSVALLAIVSTGALSLTAVKCGVDDVQTQAIASNSGILLKFDERLDSLKETVSQVKMDLKEKTDEIKESVAEVQADVKTLIRRP